MGHQSILKIDIYYGWKLSREIVAIHRHLAPRSLRTERSRVLFSYRGCLLLRFSTQLMMLALL